MILPYVAALCGYLLLMAVLFWKVVFLGYVPASPDSVSPMATSMALDAVYRQTGAYPLWQPWSFSGMPTVEAFTYLNGLYYPGALLARAGIGDLSLQLLHFVFAGLGGFLLLKRFRLRGAAAFLGGAAFMLNQYMVTMFVYGHGSQLMTAAYMPWVLRAALELCDDVRPRTIGLLALMVGLQLQRGHVQIAYYTWIVLLPLIVLKIATGTGTVPERLKKGLAASGALALAVMIASVIYLPVFEYAPWSVRAAAAGGGASYDYATMWSLHPSELFTYIMPGAFGFGGVTYWGRMPFTDYPNYAGIVVLSLAAVGLGAERRNVFAWFLAVSALLMTLLAFGRHFSPVYDLFYHAVPFFSRFRVPSMALIVVSFNLSLLAGFGLHAVMNGVKGRSLTVLKAGSLVLAVLIVLFTVAGGTLEQALREGFPPIAYDNPDLSLLVSSLRWELWKDSFYGFVLFSALFAAVLWLRSKAVLGAMFSGVLLVSLALGDLFVIDSRIAYPSERSLRSSRLVPETELARAMMPDEVTSFLAADDEPFRIHPVGALFGENKFSVYGLESTGGYHPAKLLLYDKMLRASDNLSSIPLLRMLNVRYLLSPAPLEHPSLESVGEAELRLSGGIVPTSIYRLKNPLGRAWFVREGVAVRTEAAAREQVMSGIDVASRAVVEQAPWTGLRRFGSARVERVEVAPETNAVTVQADREALLVLSEVFYPQRWTMKIDGREVPTLKVNGLLRGVVVPPGDHRIRCSFDRSGFTAGKWISAGAFGVAFLLAVSGFAGLRVPFGAR